MKTVFICSPYSGPTEADVEQNVYYARECMADSIRRGEAPYAPHLLYTQRGILDDTLEDERKLGQRLGIAYLHQIKRLVVYRDLGISRGMNEEINIAVECNYPVEYRNLPV